MPAKLKDADKDVGSASASLTIKGLVTLAQYFVRVGARGPFEVELPLFTSVEVAGKGYRKHNIETGTRLKTECVRIGKSQGLIFRFTPAGEMLRSGETVIAVEMNWSDIADCLPKLYEAMSLRYLPGEAASEIMRLDEALVAAIRKNKGMHEILSKGFIQAQEEASQEVETETVQNNELWGAWG